MIPLNANVPVAPVDMVTRVSCESGLVVVCRVRVSSRKSERSRQSKALPEIIRNIKSLILKRYSNKNIDITIIHRYNNVNAYYICV